MNLNQISKISLVIGFGFIVLVLWYVLSFILRVDNPLTKNLTKLLCQMVKHSDDLPLTKFLEKAFL